ncbi:MAG: DUF4115 domain-containing protein [Calditrichae bacterium]|nr:DUF4115 domain-containing protein [Calditrichota bacterium]MCB9057168.1 DUF4115 domain-containing protein [Calditrichia bacterium]
MDNAEDKLNLFERLKNIRVEKGISLDNISKDSRIQKNYLEAIESGEFEKIPDVYDKLFFQTYLSYLNVEDPEKYISEFRALRKEIFYPTPTTTIQRIKTNRAKGHPVFNLRMLFVAGPILLIAVILGFMAWNSTSVGTDNSDERVKELPVRKIVAEINATERAKKDSVEKLINEQKSLGKVNVSVSAIDRTWLRFIKDKSDTTEYMLYPKNKIDISADSTLRFLVGNAAGVSFVINGEEAGVLGKSGEVISYLKITSKGIVEKRLKEISAKENNDSTGIN